MYRLKFLAVLTASAAMGGMQSAVAQSAAEIDSLSLKFANAVSPDRFFIRAGVIGVKIKTKSGDAYDVTGPFVTRAELQQMVDTNVIRDALIANGVSDDDNLNVYATGIQDILLTGSKGGIPTLLNSMDDPRRKLKALGSPPGLKAIAQESVTTAGLSLGMFLDDEYKWAVEAYVLAVPPTASVSMRGPALRRPPETGAGVEDVLQPFPLEGQKIITTKLLPPLVMLGRYWGEKNSRFRPYTGVIGMYGIFYDTKATDALNNFVGGQNPGDTTVSFKNTFGFGPMLGAKLQLNDSWHVNLNVGHVKLKTVGTLVTRNSLLTAKTTGVKAYGDVPTGVYSTASISNVLNAAEEALWPLFKDEKLADEKTLVLDPAKFDSVRSIVSRVIAYQRYVAAGGDPTKAPTDQGTFVRKADSALTNTLFMLSVGRTF